MLCLQFFYFFCLYVCYVVSTCILCVFDTYRECDASVYFQLFCELVDPETSLLIVS